MDETPNLIQFIRPGGMFTALFVIAGTWILVQVLNSSARQLGQRFTDQRMRIHQVGTALRFVIYLIATVMVIALSFRLTRELMLALGGSIAVMVGFAFKDLAASVIAGIIIIFDRPFQVGDRVNFGGYYGEITAIGLRSVRLVTLDDNLVTIPNNKFLTELTACGNAGALDMLIQMDFFIGVDQDLARAKQIVTDAITSSRYAYLKKPYTVLVNQVIVENYVAVRLRAKVYVLDLHYEKALETDVNERVMDSFRTEQVQPPAVLHRNLS